MYKFVVIFELFIPKLCVFFLEFFFTVSLSFFSFSFEEDDLDSYQTYAQQTCGVLREEDNKNTRSFQSCVALILCEEGAIVSWNLYYKNAHKKMVRPPPLSLQNKEKKENKENK